MKEYEPSLPETVTFVRPDGPVSVRVAPGTTAPESSVTCPRKLAVCAESGKETAMMTNRSENSFIFDDGTAAIGGAAKGRILAITGYEMTIAVPPEVTRRGAMIAL